MKIVMEKADIISAIKAKISENFNLQAEDDEISFYLEEQELDLRDVGFTVDIIVRTE